MRKFVKGNLTTIVEDNDQRIEAYKAAGWNEVPFRSDRTPTETAILLKKTIKDVHESEPKQDGKKPKATAHGKKINDAVKANKNAAAQSEPVDDGLIVKGGKK